MDVEDAGLYIKHLAYFVRTHERALADSVSHSTRPSTATSSRSRQGSVVSNGSAGPASSTSSSSKASTVLSLSSLGLSSTKPIKPAKLFLTPNQLYFLLTRFEELGVNVGPLDVRLEDILAESSSSYMSFLAEVERPKCRNSDRDSIHSVSSVRSVMSSMSSMWSKLTLSERYASAKADKARAAMLEDIRYLYSSFTKIPSLKLANDHRIRRIAGYEEFPFDTAVPLNVFKNVTVLEVVDVDFRSFYGWDRIAEQLRSLVLRRACVDDPTDILTNVVLDDMDGRRWRSSKNASAPISAPLPSPRNKYAELSRSSSVGESPFTYHRRQSADLLDSITSPYGAMDRSPRYLRKGSNSPSRPSYARKGSVQAPSRSKARARRSSDSSNSTGAPNSPRTSSTNLLLNAGQLPPIKWRFLRHLGMNDNGLTNLTETSLSPVANTLQSLDLSSNQFSGVPESLATMSNLRALNLSNCVIDSLQSLKFHPLPAVSVLSLKGNRLESLDGVEHLRSLERLDVRENMLADPMELTRLCNVPGIKEIYVSRNPFTKTHPEYRASIFNAFRARPRQTEDILIDGMGPSAKELRELRDFAPRPRQASSTPGQPISKDHDASQSPSYEPVKCPATPPVSSSAGSKSSVTQHVKTLTEECTSSPKSQASKRRIMNAQQQTSTPTRPSLDSRAERNKILANSPDRSPEPSTEAPLSPKTTPTRAIATTEVLEANLQYRRRLEALQQQQHPHGEHWLSILRESTHGTFRESNSSSDASTHSTLSGHSHISLAKAGIV